MPFFRCGGSTLSTIAKSQILERLRTYCGNNFTLSVTWVEYLVANIDGIGSSTTSTINVTNHSGFNALSNFFISLYSTLTDVVSYTSTVPGATEGVYYQRWVTFWRATSPDSINNDTGQLVGENAGHSGNANLRVFNLAVPENDENLSKFDKQMLMALRNITGNGGMTTMTISNNKQHKSIVYNIPSWLPNLFQEAGYEVTLPSNYSATTNGNYQRFETRTSTFLSATYTG